MKIKEFYNVQRRFLRSAHLERDFRDPSALSGYVATPHVESSLRQINAGLSADSGQRAWRITGRFGSGKSSFALLLAQLYARREAELAPQLRRVLDEPIAQIKQSKLKFLPVLVTGSREPISNALVRALSHAEIPQENSRQRIRLNFADRARRMAQGRQKVDDTEVLELIRVAQEELATQGIPQGMLIILDELGKFLEYAALHPGTQDVYFLQQLAELASRSPGDHPLFVVGLLHQSFDAYAQLLTGTGQREWEKISGRFQELYLEQPLVQVAELIGSALGIAQDLPRGTQSRAQSAMRAAVEQGWYGPGAPITALIQDASALYPIHPTVVPVLVRMFSHWGQNERSLFSFLLSEEAYGLQAFAEAEASAERFYRLPDLYDYTAANLGHRLAAQHRSYWNHIDSVVRSFPSRNANDLAVLKTVGLLNILSEPQFVPSVEALALAIADGDVGAVQSTLDYLHKDREVLYLRGKAGGYCLWAHTSVNLDVAYEEASRALPPKPKIAAGIKPYLETRPILARRHYIKTGSLRCFDVIYCEMQELETIATAPLTGSDGRLVVPLCETPEESALAATFAKSLQGQPTTMIGVPEPLMSLGGLLHELERWNWVQRNTPGLNQDNYASEEVTRRVKQAKRTLENQVQQYAGITTSSKRTDSTIRWYLNGEVNKFATGRELLLKITEICNAVYNKSPIIQNELINRRFPSGQAVLARNRLVDRLFSGGNKEFLGMEVDPQKKPPEMGIYMSIVLAGKIHLRRGNKWQIVIPRQTAEHDPCRIAPALEKIGEILKAVPDTRVPIPKITEALKEAPYGVKDGLIPLLLAIYLKANGHRTALYEDGTYVHEVSSAGFQRMAKEPEFFELQHCAVDGVRSEVFAKVVKAMGLNATEEQPDLLDVVEPLAKFAARLPAYARQTKTLSVVALAVRSALLEAREPGKLLFTTLPEACGIPPFKEGKEGAEHVEVFVETLQKAVMEIQTAYGNLINRLIQGLQDAFNSQRLPEELKTQLIARASALKKQVNDPALKAFLFRLGDGATTLHQWIESIASLLTRKPAERWNDGDEVEFYHQLAMVAQRMQRVEAIQYKGAQHEGCRLVMTRPDGHEVVQIFDWDTKSPRSTELERDLREILARHGKAGLATASRVVWDELVTRLKQ